MDKLSFFDKGAAPTGSNSALIWRFPVAGSQVAGGVWALNGRRGGLIVDTWPSGHGPWGAGNKILRRKKKAGGHLFTGHIIIVAQLQDTLFWVSLALLNFLFGCSPVFPGEGRGQLLN